MEIGDRRISETGEGKGCLRESGFEIPKVILMMGIFEWLSLVVMMI